MELDFRAAAWERLYCCCRAWMIVADLHSCRDLLWWSVKGNPVAALHDEFVAVERGFIPDHDAVMLRVQFDHVHRLRRGDAQAFALANGVKLNALVVPEHMPVQVHDLAAMLLREVRLLEKLA